MRHNVLADPIPAPASTSASVPVSTSAPAGLSVPASASAFASAPAGLSVPASASAFASTPAGLSAPASTSTFVSAPASAPAVAFPPAAPGMPVLPSTLAAVRRAEFEAARDDLFYFVRHYCSFEDKDDPAVIVPFHPWPAQEKALALMKENRCTLFLKARQIGITWVALMFCAHELIFSPGHTVLALSKTHTDARELVRRFGLILSHARPLLAGGGITFTVKKNEVTLTDGKMTSVFQSFAAAKSAGRSFTANLLLMDEWAFQEQARELWASVYPTINRPTGGRVIGISTAKRGTLFEELWQEDNTFAKCFLSVFTDPRRNAAWYEATARDLGERIHREYPRSAEEAFEASAGRFFHEFDPARHVIAPFDIPADWEVYTAMDYGLDCLAHYHIALSPDGVCYVFHEIFESGLVVSAAAAAIRAAEASFAPRRFPRARLAPPDLFARELTSGKSQALAFEEEGFRLVKSTASRAAGWLCVKELLRPRAPAFSFPGTNAPDSSAALSPGTNAPESSAALSPGTNASDSSAFSSPVPGGRPRLQIFSTCPALIRSLASIAADEDDPGDCALRPHELTHAPDALRYFAVYRRPAGAAFAPADLAAASAEAAEALSAGFAGEGGLPAGLARLFARCPDLADDYARASKEERERIRERYAGGEIIRRGLS